MAQKWLPGGNFWGSGGVSGASCPPRWLQERPRTALGGPWAAGTAIFAKKLDFEAPGGATAETGETGETALRRVFGEVSRRHGGSPSGGALAAYVPHRSMGSADKYRKT